MYTDFLTKIHNAQRAGKPSVKAFYTNMDMAVADILVARGFVASANKKGRSPKRVIEVELKYTEGVGAITDITFISVPSRRIYAGYKDIKKVKQGYGTAVISTPKGLMTADVARKQKLGGELLFEIW
ncbi:MAG: 30S ribosomal protein S8 [Janthinobacterium sp.]|jgi:small subunit ribosomal protein S8